MNGALEGIRPARSPDRARHDRGRTAHEPRGAHVAGRSRLEPLDHQPHVVAEVASVVGVVCGREAQRGPGLFVGLELVEREGLETVTPADPLRRGGHVAIRHPDATRLHADLAGRKVIVDRRDPDILRLGMSPLTTRFTDVHDAITILAELA